jgi:hypothetical protein
MENIKTLTTPEDFTAHYYAALKEDLALDSIQLSKIGFAGFFLHVLGNTQYDVKGYFDKLFGEAFPITAVEDGNLIYHSNLYGYNPGLASYSILNGVINVDISAIPPPLNVVKKREIIFQDINFILGDIPYAINADYSFIWNNTGGGTDQGYVATITDKDKKQKTVPFTDTIPLTNAEQYRKDTVSYTSSKYIFGSYYPFQIELGEDYITDIEVSIEGEEYDIKGVKGFSSSTDAHVFYQILPGNVLAIELGNGIHGKYVPASNVAVTLYKTKGQFGNVAGQETNNLTGSITIYDYDETGNVLNSTVDVVALGSVLTATIYEGIGGKDPLAGEDLRDGLIKYIQSRENILSETDFYNILGSYYNSFELIFKKTGIIDNIIYLYTPFLDKYQTPIHTETTSVLVTDFEDDIVGDSIYKPETVLNGVDFVSPFLYKYDEFLRAYKAYLVKKSPIFFLSKIEEKTVDNLIAQPLVYLQLEYNITTTKIYVKSHQDISTFIFSLSIPSFGVDATDQIMVQEDTNMFSYTFDGVLDSNVDIIVDAYIDVAHYYAISFEEVNQLEDLSDLVTLKKYTKLDGNEYVINIPLLEKDVYEPDELFYNGKIEASFGAITLPEDRSISDEVQVRFLNTYIVRSEVLIALTKQAHDFNLRLPLVLSIDIDADKADILARQLNISTEIENLREELAVYLYDNHTGTNISFYRTKIIDIVHNRTWTKSVTATITDTDGTEIPGGNIESINQKTYIKEISDKEILLDYSPIFWSWDLNNININFSF